MIISFFLYLIQQFIAKFENRLSLGSIYLSDFHSRSNSHSPIRTHHPYPSDILHRFSLYNLFIQAATRIYCDSPLIPFDSITQLKFAPPAAFLWVYRTQRAKIGENKKRIAKLEKRWEKLWNQELILNGSEMICEWMIRVGWAVQGISLLTTYFELALTKEHFSIYIFFLLAFGLVKAKFGF